jgi:hypothetical protein
MGLQVEEIALVKCGGCESGPETDDHGSRVQGTRGLRRILEGPFSIGERGQRVDTRREPRTHIHSKI